MAAKLSDEKVARITAALEVLREEGLDDSASYDLLSLRLPLAVRPRETVEGNIRVNITGPGECSLSEQKRLSAALRKVWTPVTVKVGRKEWTVEAVGDWYEW